MKASELIDKYEAEVMFPVIRRLVKAGYIAGGLKRMDGIIASFEWHFNMAKRALRHRSMERIVRVRNEKELSGTDVYVDMTKEELLEYAARKHSFILVTGILGDEDFEIAGLDFYALEHFDNAVFSHEAMSYWSEAELLTIFLYESLYRGYASWRPKRTAYRKGLMRELYGKITERGSEYKKPPYKLSSLGESMRIVQRKERDWFMPIFILDDESRTAYKVVDEESKFMLADIYDINMYLLNNICPSYGGISSFCYAYLPTTVKRFKNGLAEVTWVMNDAGMYYDYTRPAHERNEMTAFIDKKGRVVVPFQCMPCPETRREMRKEAERIMAAQK